MTRSLRKEADPMKCKRLLALALAAAGLIVLLRKKKADRDAA